MITPIGRRHLAVDTAVAVALFVLFVLGVLATRRLVPMLADGPLGWHLLAGAAMTLPLAVRRRRPVLVLWVVSIGFAVFRVQEGPDATISSVALFIAIYTVGAELPPARSRTPRAVVVVAMAALVIWSVVAELPLLDMGDEVPLAGLDRALLASFGITLNIAFFVAAWVMGDLVWRRRQTERDLQDRARELNASREALARQAVQDERVRIAHELHDVVAHHVSVMGIQAGAARRAIDRDPVQAGQALAGVEQASRDAVTELHRLLGFLRSVDGEAATITPQPKLAELDDLIDTVRDLGLEVAVAISGAQRPLPDSVELSAYRIVQEALTNTLRHATGATRAEVSLSYEGDRLRIIVRDDGAAGARTAPEAPGGRGLVGMRERAALHAGELDAGPRAGAGFEVAGWLPIREGAT